MCKMIKNNKTLKFGMELGALMKIQIEILA